MTRRRQWWKGEGMPDVDVVPEDARAKAQTFFEAMAAEIIKPHCDERTKAHHRAVLIRAEEMGIYLPQR